jgi:hypothetical protein
VSWYSPYGKPPEVVKNNSARLKNGERLSMSVGIVNHEKTVGGEFVEMLHNLAAIP